MANIIHNYECVYILNANLDEEQTKANVAKIDELIGQNGTLVKTDEWGKRRLAYEIKDMNEGYYVFSTFTSGAEFPAELDRLLKISDNVLRSIIVNTDEK